MLRGIKKIENLLKYFLVLVILLNFIGCKKRSTNSSFQKIDESSILMSFVADLIPSKTEFTKEINSTDFEIESVYNWFNKFYRLIDNVEFKVNKESKERILGLDPDSDIIGVEIFPDSLNKSVYQTIHTKKELIDLLNTISLNKPAIYKIDAFMFTQSKETFDKPAFLIKLKKEEEKIFISVFDYTFKIND